MSSDIARRHCVSVSRAATTALRHGAAPGRVPEASGFGALTGHSVEDCGCRVQTAGPYPQAGNSAGKAGICGCLRRRDGEALEIELFHRQPNRAGAAARTAPAACSPATPYFGGLRQPPFESKPWRSEWQYPGVEGAVNRCAGTGQPDPAALPPVAPGRLPRLHVKAWMPAYGPCDGVWRLPAEWPVPGRSGLSLLLT